MLGAEEGPYDYDVIPETGATLDPTVFIDK